MTGPSALRGKDLSQAAKMAADEANAAGGIKGRYIEVNVYDDMDKPALARELAGKIADGPAVAVVGHVGSSTAIAAGQLYKSKEIPAITGAASAPRVTENNEWFFRLLPDSSGQGRFLSDYAQYEFEAPALLVVREAGTSGDEFAKALEERAVSHKVKIAADLEFQPADAKDAAAMADLAGRAAKAYKKDTVIVFGVQYEETAAVMTALRDKLGPFRSLGYSSLATTNLDDQFPETDASRKNPGYCTQGLTVAAPQLGDVAESAQTEFSVKYRKLYGKFPNPEAVRAYEGTRLILLAVQAQGVTGTLPTRQADRRKIRDWLAGQNKREAPLDSVGGPLYFDAKRNAARGISVGTFRDGRLTAAPVQFTPVLDPERIPGWEGLLADGKVVGAGNERYVKTPVVYGGIEMNSIDDINIVQSSFAADFFIWFRYSDQLSLDLHRVEFPTVISGATLGKEVAHRDWNGYTTVTYHVTGVFKGDYEFSRYPFDKQTLLIPMQFHASNNYNLILAYSTGAPKVLNKLAQDGVSSNAVASGDVLSSKLWVLNSRAIFRDEVSYKTFFGDDGAGQQQSGVEVNRLNSVVRIERDVFGFAVKNFLPLLCILIAILIGYVIAPTVIDSRISIGVTALLTTSVLYQKLASDLPTVTYITATDYVFFAFFGICVAFLLLSVVGYERAKRNASTKLLNRGGFVLTILSLGLTLVFAWVKYWGMA